MIIILAPSATEGDIEELVTNLKERRYGVHLSQGVEKTIVGVIGAHDDVADDRGQLAGLRRACRADIEAVQVVSCSSTEG